MSIIKELVDFLHEHAISEDFDEEKIFERAAMMPKHIIDDAKLTMQKNCRKLAKKAWRYTVEKMHGNNCLII